MEGISLSTQPRPSGANRPARKSQEWAFRTGIAFVVALMLFVTFNDLASLKVFGG